MSKKTARDKAERWDPEKARKLTIEITLTCRQHQDGLGTLFMRLAENETVISRSSTKKRIGSVDYAFGTLMLAKFPTQAKGEPYDTRLWTIDSKELWMAFEQAEQKNYRVWKKTQPKKKGKKK